MFSQWSDVLTDINHGTRHRRGAGTGRQSLGLNDAGYIEGKAGAVV
jgi:hypothetical protein